MKVYDVHIKCVNTMFITSTVFFFKESAEKEVEYLNNKYKKQGFEWECEELEGRPNLFGLIFRYIIRYKGGIPMEPWQKV